MKKFLKPTSFLTMVLCLILIMAPSVAALTPVTTQDVIFTDIANTPYKEAIETLSKLGIVEGTGNATFRPEDLMTKAEAATMVKRGFKLVDINPMVWEKDPTLTKVVTYDDILQPITEAFTVPAAKDISTHWGYQAMEGVLNARIDTVVDNTYNPNNTISEKDFSLMITKALYGADLKIDFLEKGVKDGYILAENTKNTEAISRGKAAEILANIVGKDGFRVTTLFVTSDIHGNIIPYQPSGSNVKIGSLAKMSCIVEDFRKNYGEVLLLDCGDAPYNTNIANLFEGASTVEVMNAMGYDATALGNHDFDFAFEVLLRNAKMADYEFLSANTYLKDGTYPSDSFKPYIIKEIDGVKVGVIGLTDDTSKEYTHYANTTDIEFKDDLEMGAKMVAEVNEKADIVVVLSHLHNKNTALVENEKNIDISIGGGNDFAGPPTIIDGSRYLINPGKHAEAINQININTLDGEKLGVNVSQIFMSENLEENPKINEITDQYNAQMDQKFNEVIGTTTVELNGERGTVRLKESNLANLIADSQKEFMQADIVFQNGGGIRASIPQGDITIGSVFSALPFDNKLMLLEVSGKTVYEILENGVSMYPSPAGQFLQVSGINYTFDASLKAGERITSVTMNGKELDKTAKFKVVVNDFMAGGGDGYSMIKVKGEGEIVKDVKILKETTYYLRDVLREYIQKVKTVAPTVEGRITILNPAE